MQNSLQLKSTFNFFTELLYGYKCNLLYLKLKLINAVVKNCIACNILYSIHWHTP